MPRFSARVLETMVHTVEFEAKDFDTACELAYDLVENGDPDSYTTESDGLFDAEVTEIK